jgi:hypothetical protein
VIELLFQFETPQPDRQAAVGLVDGEVIGGDCIFVEDGYYYVQVDPSSMCAALSRLQSLPQVERADFVILPPVGVPYLHPDGGPDWSESHIASGRRRAAR